MLPLTAFIAIGSMMTGQIITRTGRSAVVPSVGQPIVCVTMIFLAVMSPSLSLSQLPWVFFIIALTMGTVMPVVQTTVQMLAGLGFDRHSGVSLRQVWLITIDYSSV